MLKSVKVRIQKFFAALGLLSFELIVVLLLFLLAVSTFGFFVKQIFIDDQVAFDQKVFEWLATRVTPFNTEFMEFITFLGTHTFLIPANLVLLTWFLLVRKHRWYSIKVVAIALSSTALMFVLKNFFSRERPLIPLLEPALGYSFPSGHSLMSFSFYGLLIFLSYKNFRHPLVKWLVITSLVILILLIGFSRIYLRVHYFSDVLAGFAVGVAWLIFSIWLLNKIERYSKRNIEPVLEE